MTRRILLAVLVAVTTTACFRVGPVKLSLLPAPDLSNTRDPDPTRPPMDPSMRPNGESGVTAAGADPLSTGPVSGGLTLTTLALWKLAGLPMRIGVYGTFDETGLVELDPEKREKRASAKAAQEPVHEPVDRSGAAQEEQ